MVAFIDICQPVAEPLDITPEEFAPKPGSLEGTVVGFQGSAGTAEGYFNYEPFMKEIERQLREEYGVVGSVWWRDAHRGEGRTPTAQNSEAFTRQLEEFVAKVDWVIVGVGV